MSGYKRKGDNGELEFTRAAYDTLEDACELYDVTIENSTHLTSQRGVLAFVTVVRKGQGTTGTRPVLTHTEYWPSATDLSWAAFWYQHAFKTALMVKSWSEEEKRRGSEQGS